MQCNQIDSQTIALATRFSASVEERTTMGFFLLPQEIGHEPRKKTYPEVDFLLSTEPI